jgi:uncharacterized membrane protein YheB (UPF0754 family)
MSQFRVDIEDNEQPTVVRPAKRPAVAPGPKPRSFLRRALVVILVILVVSGVAGFIYWQRIKTSPQYSLALLVQAAREGNQQQMDELVDTDSVVDSFLPQVIDKAIELYGKDLPPGAAVNLTSASEQFKPAIKRRAREEVPRVIREKTDKFERVPYWAIAIGAPWFLDIKTEGDTANITSRIENRPFELTMKRNGGVWRVVAIKDEVVARRIAEKIGQELIALTSKEGLNKAADKLGIKNVEDLKKRIEDIFK